MFLLHDPIKIKDTEITLSGTSGKENRKNIGGASNWLLRMMKQISSILMPFLSVKQEQQSFMLRTAGRPSNYLKPILVLYWFLWI